MAAEVDEAAQRAVSAFRAAEAELKEFLCAPELEELFREYELRVENYNRTLDNAIRTVKGSLGRMDQEKLVVDGIGAQKKYKRWYDAEFLANTLPAEQADEVLTERIVYEVDVERLKQLSRQGEVDTQIVEKAFHQEVQTPASLPGTPKPYIIPLLPVAE